MAHAGVAFLPVVGAAGRRLPPRLLRGLLHPEVVPVARELPVVRVAAHRKGDCDERDKQHPNFHSFNLVVSQAFLIQFKLLIYFWTFLVGDFQYNRDFHQITAN